MLLKKLLSILLMIFLLTLVIQCTTKPPEKQSKKMIKYMFWGEIDEINISKKLIGEFERKHPDIDVELIHSTEQYQGKLLTMFASNDPPDVFYTAGAGIHGPPPQQGPHPRYRPKNP